MMETILSSVSIKDVDIGELHPFSCFVILPLDIARIALLTKRAALDLRALDKVYIM